jgi:hypothetical protein
MTTPTDIHASGSDPARFLDPPMVETVVQRVLDIAGLPRTTGEFARVERCWPGRRGGFVFEWSFVLEGGPRCVLFGAIPVRPPAAGDPARGGPQATTDLHGVRAYVPEWELLVHSPDCDPGMPHLAECLDARVMAANLRSLPDVQEKVKGVTDTTAQCQLLGYRAGRRAAILYRWPKAGRVDHAVLGKTYRGDRGERLLRVHRDLARELGRGSLNHVRVPTALGYLPDQRMAVLSWSPGTSISAEKRSIAEVGPVAVDVLTALHQTDLSDLPTFAVEDECGVVRRWSAVLECLAPSAAAVTTPLCDALLDLAPKVPAAAPRPIHRDFYDRQFVIDEDGVTLLDLDTLALGDPCVDLGNLVAHLAFAALGVRPEPVDFDRLVEQVVGLYQERAGRVDRRALAFFCATALFRVGAVHAVRTTTGQRAPAMWALAGDALAAVRTSGLPRRPPGATGTVGSTKRATAAERTQ